MRLPQVEVDIVSLRGGIDLASTFLEIKPGYANELLNFEPELEGGYRRCAGYERRDGQANPCDAVYYTMEVSDEEILVGDTIAGDDSLATAVVIAKNGTMLGLTAVSGTFEVGEALDGGPTEVVTVPELDGLETIQESDEWQLAAENYYRDLIEALPGDGDALGAFFFDGDYYGFRADSGAVKLYVSTSSGWDQVDFFRVLFWDAGVMAENEIAAGTSITGGTSSAAATVKKFVKNKGLYAADASGYMVIDVTSGAFLNNEEVRVGGILKCLANGADFAIALTDGGVFKTIQHNFYAGAGTKYVYGCDGINPAWEFDGTVLSPIYFQDPTPDPSWNAPTYIKAHKTHLFLMIPGGNIAHSAPGTPLVFSQLLGAATFGLGDEGTGMEERSGDVLALYTRGRTYGLYGSSSSDWELRLISETFGAKDNTVQKIGTVYAVDDKGIAPIERVEAYGDFESSTVSRFVKPILDQYKNNIVASVVIKSRNQYRLFFDDGYVLVMGDDQYLGESLPAFSMFRLAHIPVFVNSCEDENGNEVILFGDADGFIYQMEVGYNFDGEEVEFAFRSPFMNQSSPHLKKGYKRLYLDLKTDRSVTLSIATELSYSDPGIPPSTAREITVTGGGGYFNNANWNEVYWDAPTFARRGIPLSGTGENISILLHGQSATVRPFTLQSMKIHYIPRRLKRAE